MQLKTNNGVKARTLKEAAMTVPNTLYASKILGTDVELDNTYAALNSSSILSEMLNKQHPLISTWLVLSSISICFLSALLFIIH